MLLWSTASLLRKLLETDKQQVCIFVWHTGRGVMDVEVSNPWGRQAWGSWNPVLVTSVCELLPLFTPSCHTKIIFYSVAWCWEALFCTMVLSVGSMRGWKIHSRHSQGSPECPTEKWDFEGYILPTAWVHTHFSHGLLGGLGPISDGELTSS